MRPSANGPRRRNNYLLEHDLDLIFALVGDLAHAMQFFRHHAELEPIGDAGRGDHVQHGAGLRKPTNCAFDRRTAAIEGNLTGFQDPPQQIRLGLRHLPELAIVAPGILGSVERGIGALDQAAGSQTPHR